MEWIKTTERLPEDGQEVLGRYLYEEIQCFEVFTYYFNYPEGFYYYSNEYGWLKLYEEVTHWVEIVSSE